MNSRRSLLATIGATFGLTSVAWANTSGTASFGPSTDGVDESGRAASLSRETRTLYRQRGAASLHAGYQLYRLDIAAGASSADIVVPIDFLNPHEMGAVLKNPHASLDVAFWYDGAGNHELDDGTGVVRDDSSVTRFSRSQANAILSPGVDADPLYIVAQVQTPGVAPPGQQPGGEFRFNAEVRS